MELPAPTQSMPAWQELRTRLRVVVGDPTFGLWLSSLELAGWDGATLKLAAPEDKRRWIAKRYGRVIERTASAVLGVEVQVEFIGPAGSTAPSRRDRPAGALSQGLPSFNPRYCFDQFVIGESNRLAHAAALAVAENPGQAYNPLFLYAPPGLGKTHLLHAIGNYLKHFGPQTVVRYTTAEAFTNHFLNALNTRSVEKFKEAYRSADVLLIDDIQFLASKARTEEEFFHTFNALYERGRQLVVSCDRLPRELTAVEKRLRERFEAGLVAEIGPPDFPTRRTILRKRVALDGVSAIDPGVIDLVASRVTSNVRALEGALVRIVALNSLTAKPIDRHLASAVLDAIHPAAPAGKPTAAAIQKEIAAHYGLELRELLSASRAMRVVVPRQMAIYLTRELTGGSLQQIGAAFGGRSHATVLHACAQVTRRLADDKHFADEIHTLRTAITNGLTDRHC